MKKALLFAATFFLAVSCQSTTMEPLEQEPQADSRKEAQVITAAAPGGSASNTKIWLEEQHTDGSSVPVNVAWMPSDIISIFNTDTKQWVANFMVSQVDLHTGAASFEHIEGEPLVDGDNYTAVYPCAQDINADLDARNSESIPQLAVVDPSSYARVEDVLRMKSLSFNLGDKLNFEHESAILTIIGSSTILQGNYFRLMNGEVEYVFASSGIKDVKIMHVAILPSSVSPTFDLFRGTTLIESKTVSSPISAGRQYYWQVGSVNYTVYDRIDMREELINLDLGMAANIKIDLYPEGTTVSNTNLTWSSSDENVAVARGSRVTAVSPGEATITVSAFGGAKAQCKVVVGNVLPPAKMTLATIEKNGTYPAHSDWIIVDDNSTPLTYTDFNDLSDALSVVAMHSNVNITFENLTVIPSYAIAYNNDLSFSIVAPYLQTIENSALENSGLRRIYAERATEVSNMAMRSATYLHTVDMPSLTIVGNSAFASCDELRNVNMPALEVIADEAFAYTDRLSTMKIGTGPKKMSIHPNAFEGATLDNIVLTTHAYNLNSTGDALLLSDGSELRGFKQIIAIM